jgi:hypothetical protein
LNWVIPQKNLLRKDAIALGNYLIEIWEENQQDLHYLTNQWLVSWAIGKYFREICHANRTKTEKKMLRKTNLRGIEVVKKKCSLRLDEVLSNVQTHYIIRKIRDNIIEREIK